MTLDSGLAARRAAFDRLYQHGGDLSSAQEAFPEAPTPWIDLSTGINPVPYPLPSLPLELWTRLPEPAALATLQDIAACRYGCAPENVVVAAGTQAILQILPRVFPARRVAVLGPTYSEHERCWRAAGSEVTGLADLDAAGDAEVVVVVNPNNPDGRVVPRARLLDFSARGRWLIVDEAFMDFGRDSIGDQLQESTIVLRSFGKAYGLAGLRLGFALAAPDAAARLRAALGPWPVSGPAIAIGAQALADFGWLEDAKRRLAADARWLDAELERAGFALAGGTPLFRLARHPDAARRFARLCESGVLTRPFSNRADALRFGVPTEEARARVREALARLD